MNENYALEAMMDIVKCERCGEDIDLSSHLASDSHPDWMEDEFGNISHRNNCETA
jgi:hypothetical protein